MPNVDDGSDEWTLNTGEYFVKVKGSTQAGRSLSKAIAYQFNADHNSLQLDGDRNIGIDLEQV